MKINGTLVAEGSIDIGERESWVRKGQKDSGVSHVEVNLFSSDAPSGILAKKKLSFGPFSLTEPGEITGVIYAGDEIKMTSIPEKLDIFGGIIARQITLTSLWQELEITLDNDRIMHGLGYIIDEEVDPPLFSPVVQIKHWEEVY